MQVHGVHKEQLWQQHHVFSEAHFNVPADAPGEYRVW